MKFKGLPLLSEEELKLNVPLQRASSPQLDASGYKAKEHGNGVITSQIDTNEFGKRNHGITYKLDFKGEHGDPG
jgi:hypothetical protein